MKWLVINFLIILIISGIILLKIQLYRIQKKTHLEWDQLEKRHLKLSDLATKLTAILKHNDITKTKTYQNVLTCQQHLQMVNTVWDKANVYRTMFLTLRKLIDITTTYPEFRNDREYLLLLIELEQLGKEIHNYILRYNYYCLQYNKALNIFPVNIINKFLKLKMKTLSQ
jgi:hypothetical protein